MKNATISMLVANRFGVLNKVTGLFGRRGYNITALSVGETEDPALSRITVQTRGDEAKLRQILSQVSKLEEVYSAVRFPDSDLIERELVLIKLQPQNSTAAQLMALSTEFSAKCTTAGDCVILEASGEPARIDQLIDRISPMGIVELSRTGATALSRHQEPLSQYTNPFILGGIIS